jgi:phosphohistidine phosphatase
MKTLCLIRHAQAIAEHPEGDFYRSLSPHGQQEANALGVWLKNQSTPDIILLSPAQRTEETASIILQTANLLSATIFRADHFYQASAAIWLKSLQEQNERKKVVWIIGHNPGLEQLAILWQGKTGGGMGTAEARLFSLATWQEKGEFVKRYRPML